MNSDTRVKAMAEQVSGNLEGEVCILNMKTNIYFSLNPVGSRIWDLLENVTTPVEIAAVIAEEYQVTPEQALVDVLALLKQMQEKQLLLEV